MSVPIKLRGDFSAGDVRAVARRCKDGAQVRRLLAIATILDGRSRSDAALVGGVTRQIVRDWVVRFNAEGPDGLMTRKGDCQEFRVWTGIMGKKESHYVSTQRTRYS